ncbi:MULTISPECIES: glycosyltransferase family A protein [Glaesserella]|uniref:Glycosyltransferase 2-like domain-containing protein n=1 Tax=Glaesserella australis TaxID=2094024 RepID=A0A328C246_9PAST|nr:MULTISPECIES: glycosyltransferase family A protein [Glaesserella]AUI66414.1 hypothetical protein CJD39_07375 [Glaesserella sp. 15-184]RAL19372.1 hypothetical protein C5N92_02690 [Glaesserella australis]
MKYDVAIVTPFFNTEEYLHRCIQSVLSQKNISIQFFLIDDASTDNSLSIAEYYSRIDSRITLLKNEDNLGQGESRNKAIRLANSQFIYFIDSDDYLETPETLRKLFDTAQQYQLDICSPDVPNHYFEKPMEAIACIPCKSQFIRLDIVKRFNIFQPNARSGQDGVFSHLVLSHCSRIGMTKAAKFHYTHAREGSTFASYLKNHSVVPTLIKQHYDAIWRHYDEFGLWKKNALRLSFFLTDETIRNRIAPHFDYLTEQQKLECFTILKKISLKIISNLSDSYNNTIHPMILDMSKLDVKDFIKAFNEKWKNYKHNYIFNKNENIIKKDLVICKIADTNLVPEKYKQAEKNESNVIEDKKVKNNPTDSLLKNNRDSLPLLNKDIERLEIEIKSLKGKLDLVLNTINNSTIHLISAIRSDRTNLSKAGKKDLVVSLTTLPHRLPLVHYAIESIFSQTILPEKVILWVSDVTNDSLITPELKSLVERGLEIRKIKDVGPHTKLMYSLIEYPDKTVVTVDDDIIYPANMLQYLWDQHVRFPNCIVANWARELSFDSEGKVRGVRAGKLLTPILLEKEIEQATTFSPKPNMLAFPYGTSGVLYPPKSLNKEVTNVDLFRKLCPKEDDIWFKAMAILNKTPVIVTNLGINPVHHSLVGTQQVALRHDNHGLNQNEKQMRAVFDYFDLYKYIGK